MTLILGMSKPEGVYLSVDYRVTQSGKLIDDASVKFLTVHYPPDKGGPKALLAYSGLAILPDGTSTGAWIRETLRGECESFSQSMVHLRDRLNRDIARLRRPLIISMVVAQGKQRFWGFFTNMDKRRRTPRNLFAFVLNEAKEPFAFADGSGAARVEADKHLDLIRDQLSVWPKKPRDHMGLLAAINRRVAAKDKRVSPFCQVSFIDSAGTPQSEAFTQRGETTPFDLSIVFVGVDLSFFARLAQEQATAMMRGEDPFQVDPDPAAINQEIRRRP